MSNSEENPSESLPEFLRFEGNIKTSHTAFQGIIKCVPVFKVIGNMPGM